MVIAGLVQELTGRKFLEFAEEALFKPLGIEKFEWLGPLWWKRSGMPSAASGLRLRARDLAKIGSLMLNGGRWQSQQIVPAEWVELSGQRYREDLAPWDGDGTYGYGFQWWHGNFDADEGEFSAIAGLGLGGQRLFILPKEELVVTIFSGNYRSSDWWKSERILKRIFAAYQ